MHCSPIVICFSKRLRVPSAFDSKTIRNSDIALDDIGCYGCMNVYFILDNLLSVSVSIFISTFKKFIQDYQLSLFSKIRFCAEHLISLWTCILSEFPLHNIKILEFALKLTHPDFVLLAITILILHSK